jgi:hypothetical protein
MSGMLAALGQQAVTRLSLPDRLLQAEALIRRGGGPAALEPFEAEAPLRTLLDDLLRSADLNLIGCFGVRYDMLRLLRNLAALREHAAREPALLAAPIEAPIFITGLPRSGTTFLHKLLAADPDHEAPIGAAPSMEQRSASDRLEAERIQLLGGVSLAMGIDVGETTLIPRPPRGREEVPVQISRLLHAHEIILEEARSMAGQADESGDDGTNDLLVSDVVRTNELQVWFLSQHLVDVPLVRAD